MKTTLNQIRKCSPCGIDPRAKTLTGFCLLRKNIGEGFDPDAPITITQILDSNGLSDALWCLQAVTGYEREKRLFAARQARKVQSLNTDPRVEAALKAAEDFANGLIGKAAREVAWEAARAAAREAAGAAQETAGAARETAWEAARAAAGAARAAAWAAAWTAAGEAAWTAAWEAARTVAGAARAAARENQAKDLRELCAACE